MLIRILPTRTRAICVLSLVGILATACAGLKGQLSGNRYISPLGNFEVTLKDGDWHIFDGNDENEGSVTIEGRAKLTLTFEVFRIDYSRLAAVGPEVPDAVYLKFFRTYKYALPMFKDYSSGTKILHEEFVLEGPDRAYFVILMIPESSASHVNTMTMKRSDANRELLIFPRGDFMYMLAHAHDKVASQPSIAMLVK